MPVSDYQVVVGLEVHAELKTESKVFCGCSTQFGAEPNASVCPICLGLPGSLPVLNEKAVEFAIRAGLALHSAIAPYSKFDRKNYFYPDLPKAYQVSQYDLPICKGGYVEVTLDGQVKRVGINRVHLEEEAGKSVHSAESIALADHSHEDYNRGGIPLIEIVSEPDMRSAEEARIYLERLKTILLYAEVSDCKMEEGSLRCDANISLMPKGSTVYGTRAEIKNMNSFRAVQKALEYEIRRQAAVLDAGEKVIQETRTWDEQRGVTTSMRSKEEAHDYRYFPEPDLVPLEIDRAWVEQIRDSLPEMPDSRVRRYVDELGLPRYDAELITQDRELADFFQAAVAKYTDAKAVSNWVMGEFLRKLNETGTSVRESRLSAENLVEMLKLMDAGTISGKIAKTVFDEMFETGKAAKTIVEEKGLVQISDAGELDAVIARLLEANPQSVADYRAGKEKALGFLVGQVMKETRGKANPQMVNELLLAKLK